jgi:hypothetical protein
MSTKLIKSEKNILLKQRAKKIKEQLKGVKGWKIDFCEKNPGYNTVQWGMIINNVVNGLQTDEELTKALEKYVKTLGPKEAE